MPESLSRNRHSGHAIPFEWRPTYFVRQTAKYINEDRSHVEQLKEFDPAEDIFSQFFLLNVGDSERGARRTEKLQAFWGRSNLGALLRGDKGPGTRPAALLDERSRSEETRSGGDCRPWRGSLTATKLYEELQRKRIHKVYQRNPIARNPAKDSNVIYLPGLDRLILNGRVLSVERSLSWSSGVHTPSPQTFRRHTLNNAVMHPRHAVFDDDASLDEESSVSSMDVADEGFQPPPHPEPDAERRVIYMPDLDNWGVLALAATVNSKQREALQQAIRNYIFFKPGIECKAEVTFSLAFHLPFFALRRSEKPQKDDREWDGEPLREFIDVSFLVNANAGGKEKSFIYKTQATCLVAGIDEWVWDAYGFVDTYYEQEEYRRHAEYHNDLEGLPADKLPDLLPDLLPAGDHLTPIWTPREYFLMVFESRVRLQVVPEWQDIVERLEEGMANYIRNNSHPPLKGSCRGKETESDRRSRLHQWTTQAMKCLTDLTEVLDYTIECWDQFWDGEAHYFDDLDEDAKKSAYIDNLDKKFNQLRRCSAELKELQKRCEHFSGDFKLELQVDGSLMASSQQKDSKKTMWILLLTTVVFVPVNLVAAVFNVPDILTFPINPRNFAIANILMVSIVCALVIVTFFGSLLTSLIGSLLVQPLGSIWQMIALASVPSDQQSTVAKGDNLSDEEEDQQNIGWGSPVRLPRWRASRDACDPELGRSLDGC